MPATRDQLVQVDGRYEPEPQNTYFFGTNAKWTSGKLTLEGDLSYTKSNRKLISHFMRFSSTVPATVTYDFANCHNAAQYCVGHRHWWGASISSHRQIMCPISRSNSHYRVRSAMKRSDASMRPTRQNADILKSIQAGCAGNFSQGRSSGLCKAPTKPRTARILRSTIRQQADD